MYINSYYEPLRILEKNKAFVEMTTEEMAFICGIIREKKPKKIVEIGVAAGVTTSVILNCLKLLNMAGTAFYSVDKRKEYYRDSSKQVGYVLNYLAKDSFLKQHFLYSGNIVPQVLDKIGKDVDMVILDTVHRVPGEILDFLAIYPYLSEKAIVIIHDINFSQVRDISKPRIREVISNRILYSSIAAERIYTHTVESEAGISNIGAVQVNEDTGRYIDNIFQTLFVNWSYIPTENEFSLYRECIEQHYNKQQIEWFKYAEKLNDNFLNYENSEKY